MADTKCSKQVTDELADRSLAQVIVETGLLVVIMLTALVGNSCVLYVFYKTPKLRKFISYYLITLAVSDVILSVLHMSGSVIIAALGREVNGYELGQALAFVGYSLIIGSLQTTALIAINRFFCVVKPRWYKIYFTPKRAVLMICVAWLLSIAFVTVFYFGSFATFKHDPQSFLHLPYFYNQTIGRIYGVVSQFMFIVFPLSITAVCYWKVYKTVKQHNASVAPNLNAGPAGCSSATLSKEEIHITYSLLAVVCGFVFCWIPSTVLHISLYKDLTRSVRLVLMYGTYLSSAINPVLYNLFNKPFRREFSNIFGNCFIKRDTT